MPEEIFAKIGAIKGESIDAQHKGAIEVLSWSWDVSYPGSAPAGAGSGAGKASFGNFVITHRIDRASPQLLAACATGKHIATATITVRKTLGEAESEYLTIKMKDVRVARVAQGSAEDNAETVSLLYSKVDFEYKPPKSDGSLDVGEHFKYDVRNNTIW